VDSDKEVPIPRLRKAKTMGTQPVAGPMIVEVGPSKDSSVKTLAVLRQQNEALWHIIDTQKPILGSAMNQMWLGKELVRHVGWIADALKVMVPSSCSWGSSEYREPELSLGEGLEKSEGLVSRPRVDKGKGKDGGSGSEENRDKENNGAENGEKDRDETIREDMSIWVGS
jgi:hypothetical protein